MEILEHINWYNVIKVPCKECWTYELKWFIKLHKWFCRDCAKEHKDTLKSHYLWNINETSIRTVEKVVPHSETMALSKESLTVPQWDYETMWDLISSTWFSKTKAYRWLNESKIIQLDNWYYKIVWWDSGTD
jgi:hypothetical protein